MRTRVVKKKPLLRGVSHAIASIVSAISGISMVYLAPTQIGSIAAGVYCLSLTTLFGTSATYHIPTWKPHARQIMRRFDHSAIFILISGTYTPIILLASNEGYGSYLAWMWIGASVGVVQSVLWPTAPKPLVAMLCLSLGWGGIVKFHSFTLDSQQTFLIALGGMFYSAGAIIYAVRKPDPFPTVFGYHEIFHALTLLATFCHFSVVYDLVMMEK